MSEDTLDDFDTVSRKNIHPDRVNSQRIRRRRDTIDETKWNEFYVPDGFIITDIRNFRQREIAWLRARLRDEICFIIY